LRQLAVRQPNLSDGIKDLHDRHLEKDTRPLVKEYSELLQSQSRLFSKLYIVVDALDECSDSGRSKALLQELHKLQPTLRLLVTSRPHIWDTEVVFKDIACLEICARSDDIKRYIGARIDEEDRLLPHIKNNPAFRDTIINGITQKAKGMSVATAHFNGLC